MNLGGQVVMVGVGCVHVIAFHANVPGTCGGFKGESGMFGPEFDTARSCAYAPAGFGLAAQFDVAGARVCLEAT